MVRYQCLLTHLKDLCNLIDVAANVLVLVFKAYLAEHTMEHLSTTLRKGGIKDLLLFFPGTKRDNKTLDEHFRKAGLPSVAEWWIKKQYALAKEAIVTTLKEAGEREDSPEEVSQHPNSVIGTLANVFSFFRTDGCPHQRPTGRT
jgi:hypothetical protein